MRGFGKRCLALAALASIAFLPCPAGAASGKFQGYVLFAEPNDQDARRYSRGNWGVGGNLVLAVPQLEEFVAAVGGFDVTRLLSQRTTVFEPATGLAWEQQTRQTYVRVYLGGRVGPHGNGFLRPYVGMNLAYVHYGYSIDLVLPDESDPENEIREHVAGVHHSALGWDASAGLDVNIANRVPIEVGARYLKSFNVPQQLGDTWKQVWPSYVQFYLGVGLDFGPGRN